VYPPDDSPAQYVVPNTPVAQAGPPVPATPRRQTGVGGVYAIRHVKCDGRLPKAARRDPLSPDLTLAKE
jgi:hypothetical protein